MTDHDPVNHPKHYMSHPSGVECIQITRHMSFNLGDVVKYLWRADEKGAPLEDLRKARWYLDDEIKRRESTRIVEVAAPAPALAPQWIKWKGGDCPVSPDVKVEFRGRDGGFGGGLAGDLRWEHAASPQAGDIVAYRVAKLAEAPVTAPAPAEAQVQVDKAKDAARAPANAGSAGEVVQIMESTKITDDGDWHEWGGGMCPGDFHVDVLRRDGRLEMDRDGIRLDWFHRNWPGDIVAFRRRRRDGAVKAAKRAARPRRVVDYSQDGWIEWGGGSCPIAGAVDVQRRNGITVWNTRAEKLTWAHLGRQYDIVAYRPVRYKLAE